MLEVRLDNPVSNHFSEISGSETRAVPSSRRMSLSCVSISISARSNLPQSLSAWARFMPGSMCAKYISLAAGSMLSINVAPFFLSV